MHPARLVGGIFVGGRGSRMGHVAKGLLTTDPEGTTIVARTRALLEGVGAECVLVGAHPAYSELGLPILADDPSATGPLGGMLALLAYTSTRTKTALAIACDMPFVERGLLERLLAAPAAPIVAPRRRAHEKGLDVWEPLFARYDAAAVLPLARDLAGRGERRLQALLDAAGAKALELRPEDEAALEDWDTLASIRTT